MSGDRVIEVRNFGVTVKHTAGERMTAYCDIDANGARYVLAQLRRHFPELFNDVIEEFSSK
jgi:hypothetical protein